jgi:acyl-CoA thioester hydrolase
MSMIDVLRTGVNTWECDQMGHLNVRYYFARANQGLAMLALELGLPPSFLQREGLVLRALDQHVRFVRELRPGVYYAMRAGVISAERDRLHIYEELRFVHKHEAAASMISEVALVDAATSKPVPLPASVLERARALEVLVPVDTAPRGIERVKPRVPPLRNEALELDLAGAYLGPVLPEDCDHLGVMQESAFMARVSDGIGHFFQHLRGSQRGPGIGGAALEYRYVFHERPQLGDIIEVRSGLKGLGNKTSHICHWIFNVETGRCAATSEAVAVSFDLTTRKAIDIPPEARAAMEQRIVPGLTV